MTGQQLDRTFEAFDEAWQDILVVEIDEDVAAAAVAIAREHPVRASDGIHLASALTISSTGGMTFGCFDRRLWETAGALGMDRFPNEL